MFVGRDLKFISAIKNPSTKKSILFSRADINRKEENVLYEYYVISFVDYLLKKNDLEIQLVIVALHIFC